MLYYLYGRKQYRYVQKEMKMIRNLNTNYGMTTEPNAPVFYSVAEYVECLKSCGFIESVDDLDGSDYEEIND